MLTKYKLGELVDVTRGMSLPGENYSENGELIRLTLGNFNYNGGGFKENTSKSDIYYIGDVKPEFILNKGDIITPLTEQTIGLLGSTAMIPESGKYIQSQDVALVTPDESKLDRLFCYYLVSSDVVRKQLSAAAQQTKIRHTSPDKIKDCTVWIPGIELQKRIGKILFDIDQKIALNTRSNIELEAMAKQLYDYWFVQFDFPDKNGKPYKSSGGKMVWNEKLKREIPEGWKVIYAKDLCQIKTGKEDANFSVDDGRYPFFTCSKEILRCNEYCFDGHAVLIAGNGDFNVKHYTGRFNAYQRTYVLIPDNENYYGALYFNALDRISSFHKISNGSIVKFIKLGDVESLFVFNQKNEMLYKIINSIIISIEKKTIETNHLTHLRDSLLPMLMNGQVTIE